MNKCIAIVAASALCTSMGASAHVSDDEWEKFKAEFEAMSKRVSALENENRQLREAAATTVAVEDLSQEVAVLKAQTAPSSWVDSIKISGDFRYRYENTDQQGRDDRDRHRMRARAGIKASPRQDLEVGLALATGSDDPRSTNQTLGGSGTHKDVRLDKAYFTWTGLRNTALTMGKYSNPFALVQSSGLIWDSDYRPEGIALQWAQDSLFANASYSFIESDSNQDDKAFWGLQLGANIALSESATLTASAAYVDIPVKGREALYNGNFFGNSTTRQNGVEVFANDYTIVNASVELATEVMSLPLSVYADYIENDDADALNNGYLVGIKLGKAKEQGTWQLLYQYQELDADATLGLFTDADFAGGGTDGEGHRLAAKYAIDSKWYVGASYFDNSRGVDLGSDADYKRIQFDTGIKY